MPRLFWNIEKISTLQHLVSEGKTNLHIANIFGTSESAIKMKLSREGIKKGNVGAKSKLDNKIRINMNLVTRIRVLKGEEIRANNTEFGFSDDQIKRWLKGKR